MPGLKSNTTALSGWPIRTVSPSTAPSSSSRASTPSRSSRSARKPTASSLLKSVCRTQRSGFSPRTRQPSPVSLTVKSAPPSAPARPEHDPGGLGDLAVGAGLLHDPGHREGELAQPLARRGGDGEDPQAALSEVVEHDVGEVAAVGHVDLVERDQPRPVLQPAVAAELVLDDVEVVDRVATGLHGHGVDDVDQGGAPLDVTQEVVPQPAALAGALDQPRDVGDGEGGLPRGHDAQIGHQGRERVVGDLGPRPRHARDQAGLARAREAHQPDVGHHLELEHDVELVARLAQQREPGSLALGRRQRRVAEPTPATLGHDQLRAGPDHVGQHLAARVGHDRAVGDRQHQVPAVGAVAVAAGTVAAVLGAALRAVVVVDERGDVLLDAEDHRSARPAVAAVRAAERLELLAVHRGHAVAAPPRGDVQRHPVDEGGDGHGACFRSGPRAGNDEGRPGQGRPSVTVCVLR